LHRQEGFEAAYVVVQDGIIDSETCDTMPVLYTIEELRLDVEDRLSCGTVCLKQSLKVLRRRDGNVVLGRQIPNVELPPVACVRND
jgi:hypothetical protein